MVDPIGSTAGATRIAPPQSDLATSFLRVGGMLNPFMLYASLMMKFAELNQLHMEQLNAQLDAQNALTTCAGEKSNELLALQKGMAEPAKEKRDLPAGIKEFFDANGLKLSAKDQDGKVKDMTLDEYLTSIGKTDGTGLGYAELDRIRSALDTAKEQASTLSNRLTSKAQTYLSNYNNAYQACSNSIKSCGDLVGGIIRNCT